MSLPAPADTLYARTLHALLDTTRCPACAAALPGTRCPACGLDVGVPEAAVLWRDSVAAADALRRREERIAAMRAVASSAPARSVGGARGGTAPTGSAAPLAPPAVPGASVAAGAVPAATARTAGTAPAATVRTTGTARVAPPVPTSPVPVGAPVPPRPRAPWRVQTVLQVVGAALLVAASITFLVFAWDVLTLGARAAVVGVGTLVVFVLATVLRRRGLPQGAEAVGGLAAALLLLDAWALRATGVVVVGDGPGQATASVLLCAALLAGWGAGARLRAGTVTAVALLPLAPLVWLGRVASAEGVALLLLAAAALTLTRSAPPWRSHRVDVVLLRVVAALAAAPALLVAGGAALVRALGGEAAWVAAGTLAVAAAVLVLQARADALPRTPSGTAPVAVHPGVPAVWASAAGATGTVAVAVLGATAGHALGLDRAGTWHAAVLAAALATACLPVRRAAHVALRAGVGAATAAAGVLVAGTAAWVASAVLAGLVPTGGRPPATPALAVAALGVAVVLGTRAARRGGPAAARVAHGARAVAAVVAAVAVPVLLLGGAVPPVGPSGPTALGVAGEAVVVACGVLLASRRTAWRRTARAGTVTASAVAVLLGAGASPWLAAASAVAAAVAVHARGWRPFPAAAAASTATAGGLALLGGTALAAGAGVHAATGTGLAGTCVVGALLLRARAAGAPGAERHTALATAAVVAACGWAGSWAAAVTAGEGGAVLAAPLLAAAAAGVVVVALLVDVTARGRAAVVAGAVAAAPVGALAAGTVRTVLGVPPAAGTVLVVVVVGAASVLAAHLAARRGSARARTAAELAGWSVTACGVLGAVLAGPVTTAAALAAAAAAAGGWAVHRDRRAAWWLAWVLASLAWWVVLGARGAGPVEPYLVPPGLVLVAVGAVRLRRGTGGGAPLLAGGAVLATLPTAVLPAVLVVGDRWLDRGVVSTVLAGATVTAALVLPRRVPGLDGARAGRALAVLTAALALLAPARRAGAAALDARAPSVPSPLGDALVEPWALAAGALLVGAAVVLRRGGPPAVRALVARVAPWGVLAVAAAPSLLAALVARPEVGGDPPGAVARIAALGVLAVAGTLVGAASGRRVPTSPAPPGPDGAAGPRLADLGLALAVATTLVAAVRVPAGAVDAPAAALALTTLVAVAVAARRHRRVPVWWLAVGVVALVPTLLVRTGGPRVVAWAVGAAVVVALAHAVRRSLPGPHARLRGTTTVGAAVTVADGGTHSPDLAAVGAAPRPVRDDSARSSPVPPDAVARPTDATPTGTPSTTVGPWLVARTLATAGAGVAVLGPWLDALTTAPGAAAAPEGRAAGVLAVELPALVVAVLVGAALHVAAAPGLRTPAARAAVTGVLALPVALAVDASAAGALRAVGVLALGAVLAGLARVRHDERLGLAVAAVAGVAAALRDGPEPAELPVLLVGLLAVGLGVRRVDRDPAAGSWLALGLPVAATLAAPLAALLVAPTPWRAAATLTLALAATLGGAVRRLQAPFLLGAAAALAAVAVLLTPLAATALARVDGWVLLAVGGSAVLALGLTYERRVREAREAVRVVAAMR